MTGGNVRRDDRRNGGLRAVELKPLIEACKALNPHFPHAGGPLAQAARATLANARAADPDRSACIARDARACGVWGYTWSAYLAAVALANESTAVSKAR